MIVLVFSLGAGVTSLLISFTAVGWVVYARLVRGEVLRIREAEYVVAAVTAGFSTPRIIIRHVLPNALRQTVIYLTSDLSSPSPRSRRSPSSASASSSPRRSGAA